MKNKIAIAAAFCAASSFSMGEIVINEFLSFEGFIDMSYTHTAAEYDDTEETTNGNDSESENSFAIDQVEISWLFDFDPVTAQIDLQFEDVANSSSIDDDDDGISFDEGNTVEQAFVTYHFDNGGAITAGRYASMLGFEAFEPTGLYQYSFAYDIHDAGLLYRDGGDNPPIETSDTTIIPGYAQGIKFTYEGDTTFFGISLQDEAFEYDGDRLGGDDPASSYAVEVAGALYMDNGLSFFLGGAYEDGDGNGGSGSDTNADGDTYVINFYTTFETGAWIFAGEVNYGESETGRFWLDGNQGKDEGMDDEEVVQALLMANFAYSEQGSITGRVSYANHEQSDGDKDDEFEYFKFTLAHGWAFTDNLVLVNEISYVDGEVDDKDETFDYESLLVAAELIFSF